MSSSSSSSSSSSDKIIVKNHGDGLVVQGNTYPYRDTLKSMGGLWNSNLKIGDSVSNGWVFPRIKLDEINSFIKKAGEGKVKALESTPFPSQTSVSTKDFLSLVSRVEKLEEELARWKKTISTNGSGKQEEPRPSTRVDIVFKDDDEEEEEEEDEKPKKKCISKRPITSRKESTTHQKEDDEDDEGEERRDEKPVRLLHRK